MCPYQSVADWNDIIITLPGCLGVKAVQWSLYVCMFGKMICVSWNNVMCRWLYDSLRVCVCVRVVSLVPVEGGCVRQAPASVGKQQHGRRQRASEQASGVVCVRRCIHSPHVEDMEARWFQRLWFTEGIKADSTKAGIRQSQGREKSRRQNRREREIDREIG